jgi:leucyl aminopeptidase (aminopeptidase T)
LSSRNKSKGGKNGSRKKKKTNSAARAASSPTRRSSPSSSKRNSALSQMYSKLAQKVVDDALKLKPGETVTIETWNSGLPFASEVSKQARRAGAIPVTIFEDEEAYIEGLRSMPREYVGKMGSHEYSLLSGTNAYVFIPGPPVSAYAPMLPAREDETEGSTPLNPTAYNMSWYEAADKAGLRGVRLTFGYVGRDLAKILGKKEEDIVRVQLESSLADLEEMRRRGAQIAEILQDGNAATLESGSWGEGNKLTFTLKGDLVVEDGMVDEKDIAEKNNMSYLPPGFVMKEVDPSSASGSVEISPSVTRVGLVKDATLRFENGKLVEADSKASKKELEQLLKAVPESNRSLKAMTIGYNPAMKYAHGQDRFVSGAIGLSGFGFNGMVRLGNLSVNDKKIVEKGELTGFS